MQEYARGCKGWNERDARGNKVMQGDARESSGVQEDAMGCWEMQVDEAGMQGDAGECKGLQALHPLTSPCILLHFSFYILHRASCIPHPGSCIAGGPGTQQSSQQQPKQQHARQTIADQDRL